MKIKYKEPRLPSEFEDLLVVNPGLVYFVLLFADKMQSTIMITQIFRSKAMIAAMFPNNPNRPDVHYLWRGVDVSVQGLDIEKVKAVIEELNKQHPYDTGRPAMKTYYLHDAGFGLHLHIQNIN